MTEEKNDSFWEGYQAAKAELRALMDKTFTQSPQSRLIVITAFLLEQENL